MCVCIDVDVTAIGDERYPAAGGAGGVAGGAH